MANMTNSHGAQMPEKSDNRVKSVHSDKNHYDPYGHYHQTQTKNSDGDTILTAAGIFERET